jgi:hypothetical protein
MDRRAFLGLTTQVSGLVLAGQLPLFASEARAKRTRRAQQRPVQKRNIFTEPAAIEPVTGYMDRLAPTRTGSMQQDFVAKYDLIKWGPIDARTGRPRNAVAGSLEIKCQIQGGSAVYRSVELRRGQSQNRVTSQVQCAAQDGQARQWEVRSEVLQTRGTQALPSLSFTEQGTYQRGLIQQQSSLGTVRTQSPDPMIPQEALLRLLAQGGIRNGALRFTLLQTGSAIKQGQTLKYQDTMQIPVKDGAAELACYVQTGYGVLPTHYLVDQQGRVQLITQENTNWALKELM